MPTVSSSLSESMLLKATDEEMASSHQALLQTNERLKSLPRLARLRETLGANGINLDCTFVLHEVVDNDELIYVVITEGEALFSIEMLTDKPPRVQSMAIEPYRNGLGRLSRIRLLVAQQLTTSDHCKD